MLFRHQPAIECRGPQIPSSAVGQIHEPREFLGIPFVPMPLVDIPDARHSEKDRRKASAL